MARPPSKTQSPSQPGASDLPSLKPGTTTVRRVWEISISTPLAPAPEVIAAEIMEDLLATLEQFAEIAGDLGIEG